MNAAEIEELLTKLVQIPAPTGREQKRAEYITDWLKELGYHPFTDAAGNVIVEMKCRRAVIPYLWHTWIPCLKM